MMVSIPRARVITFPSPTDPIDCAASVGVGSGRVPAETLVPFASAGTSIERCVRGGDTGNWPAVRCCACERW